MYLFFLSLIIIIFLFFMLLINISVFLLKCFSFSNKVSVFPLVLSEPTVPSSLLWKNLNFFSEKITTYFLFFVLVSLFYCCFLVLIRWNLFNNDQTFFSQFPVQTTALCYSVATFLFSCFLCFTQHRSLFFITSVTDDAILGLLNARYFLHYQEIQKVSLGVPDAILTPFAQHFNFMLNLMLDRIQGLDIRKRDWVARNFYLFFWGRDCIWYFFLSGDALAAQFLTQFTNWDFLQTCVVTSQFGLLSVDFVIPFFRTTMEFAFSFDGLSLIFICLTTFITFLCICISWYSYRREFHYTLIILLLVTQFLIILAFSTVDLILFYIAFESVLIPLFFLVGIFGSRERRIKAAYYLMFYTLFGSVPFLIGLLYIWDKTGQTNLLLLEPFIYGSFSRQELTLLWFLFLPGFAFKIPLYPFHLWLPEAHVEAPTVGSVILAGLVLKLGGYGFIRFSIGLLYWGGISYLNIIYWFCLFSMLCAILCAACQIDLKRIIAYGSISHMALVTLCIFLGTQAGLEAAMIMMLGHGFVSSALFILIGGLYERYHSRNVRYYGGLYRLLPKFGTFFFLFILFDIGVPGSPSFVAELLAFISVTQQSVFLAIFMAIPVIIGAGVSLLLCSRVLFGLNEKRYYTSFQTVLINFFYWVRSQTSFSTSNSLLTLSPSIIQEKHVITQNFDFLKNEIFVLSLLLLSALVLGVWPQSFLQWFQVDIENLLMTVTLINF